MNTENIEIVSSDRYSDKKLEEILKALPVEIVANGRLKAYMAGNKVCISPTASVNIHGIRFGEVYAEIDKTLSFEYDGQKYEVFGSI